ncbi:NAD(P)(+) transhydrogenase (Re/Si-specific) subunit beta [Georgenia subflava]|uniref:NAD(P) transhydrogenase subunit beta n=1 Tax=Georgenia subflava TaxID=1622177 RepID=A0A6N7EL49_9MICO|nr:NAD(P)(+) transhydrogenase (Re/Si-specific) subunit beta [Georgenia subflava]MPV38869.1 NAD(P)(+) transhydrogenase (Re/Si-specific) subunit beta [Georgenia subflava]
MNVLPGTVAELLYLVAAVCFVLALKGLSSPRGARRGNLIGAAGATLAVATVLLSTEFEGANLAVVLGAVGVGSVVAVPAARRVKMTEIPQLVAVFNGVGGGAAALVGVVELAEWSGTGGHVATTATAFAIFVGSTSLLGSLLTFGKLQGTVSARPIVVPGAGPVLVLALLAGLALAVGVALTGQVWLGVALLALGLAFGALLVLPVGGADVPIVISLLNAFTGLAVAASGWAMGSTMLLVAGTLVGAAGTILTIAMATAMGRSVTGILFGALRGGSTAGSTQASDRPVRRAQAEDVAITLAYASRVVVVPGYGLAVAQAQHTVAELVTALRARGVDAVYGIHPVAGRMPGHMNVLLAEANVPYELLVEADDVNAAMPATDVVVVVGANDVVNPAARTDPAAPIYGMPIINADEAGQTIFLKRSMRPGFAGIENELLFAERTQVLFGDAKESLAAVVGALKEV